MTDPSATQRLLLTWAALLVGLVGVSVLGLFIGSGVLDTDYARKMFMTLRLWRILAAFGIGAALSISGVVIQAICQTRPPDQWPSAPTPTQPSAANSPFRFP